MFPILMVLLMGIIEFSLAFNAVIGINRASTDAVLVASEEGNAPGADCLILNQVETDVLAPNNTANIVSVQIQRTGPSGGSIYAFNAYDRTGSTTCTFSDGTTMTVPYTATTTGYPESQRCNVSSGCASMTPPRTTVDTVGVQVRYRYAWRTPLASLLTLVGGNDPNGPTWTFQKRNVSRMEPIL